MKKEKWKRQFLIRESGFHGHLYLPSRNEYPGKVILVLGGGGMPYKLTMDEAEAFSNVGIAALSLGYFGVKDAPKTIVRVPVEYVEKATDYLHKNGYKTVIAAGISKGAELALVSASLMPQINGVIAFSPSSRINMAIGPGISWLNASSWTYNGEELPYAYAEAYGLKAVWDSLKARELTFRPVYEKAYRPAGDDSFIPVEKICGPVLVCASTVDSLWPSETACREIADRLSKSGFPFPFKQLIYPYASHILLPFETGYEKYFRICRKEPEKCRQTIYNLQKEVLEWLKSADIQ